MSTHIGTRTSQAASVVPGKGNALRIEPTASRRKWIARLGDRVLCTAAAPFVQSARVLLSEGYPPEAWIEMCWPNTTEWALRGRIGPVAATVLDGETAASRAKKGPPLREMPETKVSQQATPEVSPSARSWRER